MNRTQRHLAAVKRTARDVARHDVTENEAHRRHGTAARFELMHNGRCYWLCRLTGLQGSEPA